ncbi:MAG: hypothetical protein MEQ07_04415 [Aquimonas sp.]|nr:hypothetical protein [Aquimonas sp.]
MHARFVQLQLPRNPILRVLLGVLGIALLGLFALAGATLAVVGLAALGLRGLWLRLRGSAQPRQPQRPFDPDVIEGDYRVVERPRGELRGPES